jgi:eukaryotic-like serine/threonine-protein kinase
MVADINGKKKRCTTCGALYDISAKYCGLDGTALRSHTEAVTIPPAPIMDGQNQCLKCAMVFPGYARFCPADGSALVRQDKLSSIHVSFAGEEDEVIGRTFAGKYKIDTLLGEGGMAKVYKATHLEIEKTVVIKLMRQQLPKRVKDTSLKRFLQEIKVTAKLNHPNLVSVFDGGELDGRPYLVMEFIQGDSLRQYINSKSGANFADAINIISQTCAGLSEAHAGGIIHRDLKPENIMLRDDCERPDWVKIVDFGIAHLKQGNSKLTATGVAIGTVDYMSPEYLSDKPTDHRADIYALGVILYELLTGKCPFEAQAAEAVMMKHLWTAPPPPSATRADMTAGCALDRIFEKALEKDPANRYQSVLEMRKELQNALANPAGPP